MPFSSSNLILLTIYFTDAIFIFSVSTALYDVVFNNKSESEYALSNSMVIVPSPEIVSSSLSDEHETIDNATMALLVKNYFKFN